MGIPDVYVLRARVAPVIIICLPVIAMAIVDFTTKAEIQGIIAISAVSLAIITLLAQLGRERGKYIENGLFQLWGGKPTTVLLRHRDKRIDRLTKLRLHKRLSEKVTGIRMPTPEEEAKDTEEADRIYNSAVTWLRNNTRNSAQFPCLCEENISYGFRRNLFGLKRIGLVIATITLCLKMAFIWPFSAKEIPEFITQPAVLASILVAIFLIFVVNTQWVKNAAEAYASALFDAVEML